MKQDSRLVFRADACQCFQAFGNKFAGYQNARFADIHAWSVSRLVKETRRWSAWRVKEHMRSIVPITIDPQSTAGKRVLSGVVS
jgi:hypothetical protein